MFAKLTLIAALALPAASLAAAATPTDPQIAHVAYTAGLIDIASAKQALAKSRNAGVRAFAEEMVRDHTAVNDKALALFKKLNVTPQDSATSQALRAQADVKHRELAKLDGAAFDRAYAASEVAYHQAVISALRTTLIPDTHAPELKALLQTGLRLFTSHLAHAQQLAGALR